jgi:O-antigen/teichoic acid export membrane protein
MSVRRFTAYNMAGQVVPLALALLTIPLYLKVIGDARYGVLAIVWLMLGYFGLFDLGLGQAAAQRLARLADAGAEARARVFGSALVVNLVLGLVGAALAWPLASWFFGRVLSVDDALRAELLQALPWIVLTLPAATLSGVLTGGLQARERFLELNVLVIAGQAAIQLVPLLVAVLAGPSLATLVPAVLVSRWVVLVLLFDRCLRHVSVGVTPTWDRLEARGLLRYGSWVSVTAVVGPLMVILDRFVIGALLGARAVSHYTIPFQVAERTTMLSASLNQALFPRLVRAADAPERQRLALEALRTLTVLMTPLVALGLLLVGPFLRWWVSAEMAEAATRVAQVLLLGFWFNSLAMVPYAQLQAAGRPDLVAKCHLVELLPYLALLYGALQAWGLVGAALAFALRAAADCALLTVLAGTASAAWRLMMWPAVALALIFAGLASVATDSVPRWMVVIPVLMALLVWSAVSLRAAVRGGSR